MMHPKTKYILDKIEKIRADDDTYALVEMKDYWDGFADGINIIAEVLDRIKIDMIIPVKEALEEKKNGAAD